nr:unnamed protein product [Callosobruchus chinensis]
MTVEEIKETYRMIQMSKKSKEEDEKKRSLDPFSFEMESDDSDSVNENIHSLVEELCSPSTLRLQKKEVTEASEQDNKGDNNLNGLENLNLLDATKVKFGYLDMPPMEKCDHQLINHKSNFVALQQTEEYCNANCATKVKMLSWHWSKISKTEPEAQQAKLSSNQTKHRSVFSSMLVEVNNDTEETYISRSGRHSKRKCYATSDDESNDVNTTPKKSKTNDRKWQSNSSNNDNNLNSETKIKTAAKKRKSTPIKDIEKESKSESDSKNLDNVPTLTPLENEEELLDNEEPDALEERFDRETPKAPLRSKSKKLSNDEIMKRSSLFGVTAVKKKRSEEMLNKLIEEQARKKKEERLMEKFEKSIDSTIEDDDPEPVSPLTEVKMVYPRRVIPPVPRKNLGSRSNKIAAAIAMSNQAANSTTSQDPEVSSSSRTTTRSRLVPTRQDDKIEVAPTVSNADTSGFAECPICQKSFHIEAIQTHASTCGDDDSSSPATKRLKRIQCEICGGHFPFGDRYNIHVTDCLQARQGLDIGSQLVSKYKK